MLEHHHPDCIGRWKQKRIAKQFYWCCTTCQAAVSDSHVATIAVQAEHALDLQLRLLESEGRCILAIEQRQRGG